MKMIVEDMISSQGENLIRQGIKQYNQEKMQQAHVQDLAVYVVDDCKQTVGGLIGYTHGDWLFIKWLWLSAETRGQHVGEKLLRKAEKVAIDRGCHMSFLDTYEFQAPLFYKRYGYSEVMVIEEHLATGKHYYMTKKLI